MGRTAVRIANAALFTLSCYLVAGVVNEISADLLEPPNRYAASAVVASAAASRSWEDRRPILDRNLFGAQLEAEATPEPEPVEEPVVETALPLRLLATMAFDRDEVSRAAIRDKKARRDMVVRVGDELETQAGVIVASIERGRVLLRNGSRREELLLDDGSFAELFALVPQAKAPPAPPAEAAAAVAKPPEPYVRKAPTFEDLAAANRRPRRPSRRMTEMADRLAEFRERIKSGEMSLNEVAREIKGIEAE